MSKPKRTSSLNKIKPAARSATTAAEKMQALYGANQTTPAVPFAHRKIVRNSRPTARRVTTKATQAD